MLDKTKKFGTVHGMGGVKYSQGGKLFDNHGVEVNENGERIGAVVEAGPVVEASGVAIETEELEAPVEKSATKKRRWI